MAIRTWMAELTYTAGFNSVRDLVPGNAIVAPSTAPVTLVTGANQGTVIDEITLNAVTTTSAGYVNIYIKNTAASTDYFLHSQIPVSAVTPSTTVATWSTVIRPLNLKLHSNQVLCLTYNTSSPNAEQYHATASVTEL